MRNSFGPAEPMRNSSSLSNAGAAAAARLSDAPFPIDQPGSAWIVRSGHVDLFLVRTDDGQPAGARWHVLRVHAGETMFGIEGRSRDVMLLARPAPGSAVEQVAIDGLLDPVLRFERWAESLGEAAAMQPAAKQFVPLEYGQAAGADEQQTRHALPVSGVVWVRRRGGVCSLFGEPQLALPGACIPVSRGGWIAIEAGAEVDVLDGETVRDTGLLRRGIAGFHELALAALLLKRERLEVKEHHRLAAKARSARNALENSMVALRSPLESDTETAHAPKAATAVVRACEIAAGDAGLTVQAPAELPEGSRSAVVAVANASGLRVRQVLLREEWWKQYFGPMVAFRERTPVALIRRRAGGYRIQHPDETAGVPVTEERARELTGVGYLFYRPLPNRRLGLKDLLSFGLNGSGRDLGSVALMGVASGLLGLVAPLSVGLLLDHVIPNAQRGDLALLAVLLIVTALSSALFSMAGGFATLRIETRLATSLQSAMWDRLLNLPASFFRKYTSGDLANRSMAVDRIRQTITGSIVTAVLAGIFSTFQFVLLFYYSAFMGAIAVALLGVAFVVATACGILQLRCQRQAASIQGRISGIVSQFINGISKIRVAGAEMHAFAYWAQHFTMRSRVSVTARRVANALNVFNGAFPVASLAIVFWAGLHLMQTPGASPLKPGEFLAFLAAFQMLLMSVLQVSTAVVPVLGVVAEYERVRPILETLPETGTGKADPGELQGGIEINRITFRYRPDQPPVLRDFSLSIKAGEFVAVVGESGSGKSTLLRILLGFETPEAGAVYFDRHALSGLNVSAVRRQIGVVLQSGRLMSGSMLSNIVGALPLSPDEAWEAARLAGIEDDIKEMPMGMHTILSEGGGGISGGQRQRLLIARAIVNRPRMLFFDEATSALDNRSQALISESLERLKATRIVIAHRLSTIRNADRIIVMQKGVLVESGTYDELLNQNGVFADLARRQITGEGENE